jgi:hypothetical protein
MILGIVVACVIFAWMACCVVWIVLVRSADRRAEAEEQARDRKAAERVSARIAAGMPAGHPETPGGLTKHELVWLGAHYAAWTDELADIDVANPGGTE